MYVQNKKFIPYNFPTKIDSKNYNINSSTFIILKCYISNNTNKIKNEEFNALLDSGSYCNFISTNLVNKLNLITHQTLHPIQIKGISGATTINHFVYLKFQSKICINNSFHIITFKEKFLVTNNIPVDLLLGNQFMKKYQLQFNYKDNFIFKN